MIRDRADQAKSIKTAAVKRSNCAIYFVAARLCGAHLRLSKLRSAKFTRLVSRTIPSALKYCSNCAIYFVAVRLCGENACQLDTLSLTGEPPRNGPSEEAAFDDTFTFRIRLSPNLNGKFIQTYLFFALSSAIAYSSAIAKCRRPPMVSHASVLTAQHHSTYVNNSRYRKENTAAAQSRRRTGI